MTNEKQKQEKAISSTGCHIFDGNLTLRIGKKEYKVHCEYFGLDLKHASQEHQIVMLIKQHLPYDEIDTGWLVRTKDMDKEHRFGLKAHKNDRTWAVYNYNDVVAWGYADGGLNSSHFNSCRLRPEDYPQFASEPEDELDDFYEDDDLIYRKCVKLRAAGDDQMEVHAIFGENDDVLEPGTHHAKGLFRDCAMAFNAFRKEHPEVMEIHFYTDELVRNEE